MRLVGLVVAFDDCGVDWKSSRLENSEPGGQKGGGQRVFM